MTKKTKWCPKCKQLFHTDQFYTAKLKNGKVRLLGHCKQCVKNYQASYAKRRPDLRKKYFQKCLQNMREFRDSLKDKACADCGVKYPPYVMDFDHRGEKNFLISKCAHRIGRKKLLAEAAKCDVVCANCHRERTHRRRSGQL